MNYLFYSYTFANCLDKIKKQEFGKMQNLYKRGFFSRKIHVNVKCL